MATNNVVWTNAEWATLFVAKLPKKDRRIRRNNADRRIIQEQRRNLELRSRDFLKIKRPLQLTAPNRSLIETGAEFEFGKVVSDSQVSK